MLILPSSTWYVSACLKGEYVGLKEVDDGRWKVYFGKIPLGIMDIKTWQDKGCRQFGTLVRLDGEVAGKGLKSNRRTSRV